MRTAILLFVLSPLVIAAGCGTSEPTEESAAVPAPQPPPPPKAAFETRTDTVSALHRSDRSHPPTSPREAQVRFMVQIGAFKDPQRASRIQTTARERYHLPVLNDYNSRYALYQIRIGFFESRDAAYTFRQRMRQDFPSDYNDAWVVQLKR